MRVEEQARLLLAGQRRALARAISAVERGDPAAAELLRAVLPHGGRAHVVGITGSPGVGKSTLLAALVGALRARGRRVGVLAVDPSSPFTGGALLGDRIRLAQADEGVFFRSLASRGGQGGVARATGEAVDLLDAAGYETVLVETVGAGQSEVAVMRLAHTVVVVTAPGLGDEVQAAKAGILEIGHVFVVNKADREGADRAAAELRSMLELDLRPRAWDPPVIQTVAREGRGVEEVLAAVEAHAQHLRATGGWEAHRRRRVEAELADRLGQLLLQALREAAGPAWEAAVADVAARRADLASATAALLGAEVVQRLAARLAGAQGTAPAHRDAGGARWTGAVTG